MKYTKEQFIEKYCSGETIKYVFFWGHTEKGDEVTKACFSQWYPCTFVVDDVTYHTAEQYMMAQKARLFGDLEIFKEIMAANNPKTYKDLGRKIRGFNEAVWNANKAQIVIDGNYAKFTQNPVLGEFLAQTGSRVLVEASPYDAIWGIKMATTTPGIENPAIWKGQNLLGFALMEVRDMIKEQE